MKKFLNSTDDFLKESLQGFGAAHEDIISCHYEPNFITRSKATKKGKVAIISGGGSGHEPMHGGFVGYGICLLYTSPSPRDVEESRMPSSA